MAQGIIQDAYLKAEHAEALNASYTNAQPCKYLVMENFFTEEIANDLFENFPSIQDLNVKRKSLNEDKAKITTSNAGTLRLQKFVRLYRPKNGTPNFQESRVLRDCTQPQTPWALGFTK